VNDIREEFVMMSCCYGNFLRTHVKFKEKNIYIWWVLIALTSIRRNDTVMHLWQEPVTTSVQLPHIPASAFLQTDLFLV